MKNIFFLCMCIVLISFFSCSKDSAGPNPVNPSNNNPIIIKYEFTSNLTAAYRFAYKQDTTFLDEIMTTQVWSKIVNVSRNTTSRVAKFSVYPPEIWVGTPTQANVNLKLSVDGVVKKDTSGILAGFDRALGITIQSSF